MTSGHTFQQGFPGKISIAISQFENSFVKFHHFPTWNLDMVSEIGKSFCQDNWWTPRRPAILSSIADINAVWQILHTSSFFWKYERNTSTFFNKNTSKNTSKIRVFVLKKCVNSTRDIFMTKVRKSSHFFWCKFIVLLCSSKFNMFFDCFKIEESLPYDLTGSNSSQCVKCALNHKNTSKSQKYE